MNTKITDILIRRKSKIPFSAMKTNTSNMPMVVAMASNLAQLGYILDAKLINELEYAPSTAIVEFYNTVLPILKNQIGYVNHKPMYPNFPKQVADASQIELFINAIMHYTGAVIGVRIMPVYETEPRFPLCDVTKAKWIGLATFQDVSDCCKQLFEAKSSPSDQDKADIETFISEGYDVDLDITFSNKETLAFVCARVTSHWNQIKTATDVLRVVAAMFNGDVSLTKNTKYGKLSRSNRKLILKTLERCNNVGEDMMRHRSKWVRLGEKLHPAEYTNQFPKTAEAFRKIRNEGVETFNAKVEKAIAVKDIKSAVQLLANRPGDFARRMNALLHKTESKTAVIDAFREVAESVSTPVLWQMFGYFRGYKNMTSFRNRIFLPKSGNALVAENNLKSLGSYSVAMWQTLQGVLEAKYKNLPTLGKVYIDPVCDSLLIPTGNRTASTALRQVGRGSRFKLADTTNTVRLFMYWKDVSSDSYYGRVDLDLSAIMFEDSWKYAGHCSWTNLRNGNKDEMVMGHSGDITSAPNGASEFLDINIPQLIKQNPNVRYVACNVHNYTGQKLKSLDVAFAGWMEREHVLSGEIYEPTTVAGRCDLTADAIGSCPMILDVYTKEIIWADLPIEMSGYHTTCHSTHTTMDKSIANADLASRMSFVRADLSDLFVTHVVARGGELVTNREDADFVIAEDGDVSPYDVAAIMSEWV